MCDREPQTLDGVDLNSALPDLDYEELRSKRLPQDPVPAVRRVPEVSRLEQR